MDESRLEEFFSSLEMEAERDANARGCKKLQEIRPKIEELEYIMNELKQLENILGYVQQYVINICCEAQPYQYAAYPLLDKLRTITDAQEHLKKAEKMFGDIISNFNKSIELLKEGIK